VGGAVPSDEALEREVVDVEVPGSRVGGSVTAGMAMLVVAVANPAGTTISVAWSAVRTTTVWTPPEPVVVTAEQAVPSNTWTANVTRNTKGATGHREKCFIGRQR